MPRDRNMKKYTAVIERCPDTGLYVGYIPGLPGAHSQAETLDEMNRNLKEFFEFSGKYFEWYKGPWISITFFLVFAMTFIIDLVFSMIISNYLYSFLASVGTFGVIYGMTYLIIWILQKKRETPNESE